MDEGWDQAQRRLRRKRWRRFAGAAAALTLVLFGYRAVTDKGPEVPTRVVLTVAGPEVRILRATTRPDGFGIQQPAFLVVRVGGAGDPEEVLRATLRAHGWELGELGATLPTSQDDGYFASWENATAPDPRYRGDRFPLAEYADRSDPRVLLVAIDNPLDGRP